MKHFSTPFFWIGGISATIDIIERSFNFLNMSNYVSLILQIITVASIIAAYISTKESDKKNDEKINALNKQIAELEQRSSQNIYDLEQRTNQKIADSKKTLDQLPGSD